MYGSQIAANVLLCMPNRTKCTLLGCANAPVSKPQEACLTMPLFSPFWMDRLAPSSGELPMPPSLHDGQTYRQTGLQSSPFKGKNQTEPGGRQAGRQTDVVQQLRMLTQWHRRFSAHQGLSTVTHQGLHYAA
jgi:hypothetical protein